MSKAQTSFFHRISKLLLAVFALLSVACAMAAEDFLPPEVAFKFSAKLNDPKNVEVTFKIAEGYYLYREKLAFKVDGATLGEPVIPRGTVKFDKTFQKDVETLRGSVTIKLPIEASGTFVLTVTSQGCADQGLCYAPMESKEKLNPKGGLLGALAAAQSVLIGNNPDVASPPTSTKGTNDAAGENAKPAVAQADAEMGRIEASLVSGKLTAIIPLFIVLGLGLAFTPCVLPMVPILSFLIVGEGPQVSRARSFLLSLTYSLGMALIYTMLGIAAGLAGEGLAASLQHPVILTVFAIMMAGLALAMFDFYQLQMPAAIQAKLIKVSESQSAGKMLGVFAMGALSALIIGPCVAAPLAGALLYISRTQDVVIGGSALFAMAAGMSIPLLLVGLSAGTLLPRAGAWMEEVKHFFGVLMLGMAWWIVSPILPGWLQMMGWALLATGYGIHLLRAQRIKWLGKTVATLFVAVGVMQLVGVATGAQDPFAPLAKLTGGQAHQVEFKRVKSIAELDAAIIQSKGKTVMLDFYADWCVSCKEMEKLTFTDPQVQKQFGAMTLLQADVTANNDDDKALLKRFKLFGPPGIIFFDKNGKELQAVRVIGYQNADRFSDSLAQAKKY